MREAHQATTILQVYKTSTPSSFYYTKSLAPLLVMNNFSLSDASREALGEKAPARHLEKLVTDMFQGYEEGFCKLRT
jgi:hypothetical protein